MQEVYFDEKEYLRTFSHPQGILLIPKAKLETIRDSEGKKYTEKLTYDLRRLLQKLYYLKETEKDEGKIEGIDEKIRAVVTILFLRKFEITSQKSRPDPFIK